MISEMFEVIGEAITSFISALGTALSGVTSLFYTAPTTTGGSGQFTVLGILLLIAVGVGVVYWCFRLIRSLVQQRRA